MTRDLKPCPFCGGEAVMLRVGDTMRTCAIACTECGASLQSTEIGDECGTAWNTRVKES